MLERLTFFALVVKDMEAAINFYTETLGLKIDEKESVPQYYTQFEIENVANLALISGLDDEGHGQPYEIALKVPDVDAAYIELEAKGVELISKPRDIPWGRTFLIKTPQGHVLRLYSSPKKTDP